MSTAYLVDAIRTPMGRRNGDLSRIRSDELAALPLRALVDRTGIDAAEIEDVIMGCVTQGGEQGLNIGRTAPLIAGFPKEVTGTSVNRMCGSSQQAVNFAAMGVLSGAHDVLIGAGVESMSRIDMGSDMFYKGTPKLPSEKLTWRYTFEQQGISAELVAQRYTAALLARASDLVKLLELPEDRDYRLALLDLNHLVSRYVLSEPEDLALFIDGGAVHEVLADHLADLAVLLLLDSPQGHE